MNFQTKVLRRPSDTGKILVGDLNKILSTRLEEESRFLFTFSFRNVHCADRNLARQIYIFVRL